jgi:alpha-tubulin suppressor-like RCC1 family protein
VSAIAAGFSHSLALKSDGTVWAWGDNNSGQLGDGTTSDRNAPVQVSGLTNVGFVVGSSAPPIACGSNHCVARRRDGTVWAWGNNNGGQLGNGTLVDRLAPVQAMGLTGVTSVAAGQSSSMALAAGGSIWVWGDNSSGQLGDGTVTSRPMPVQLSGLSNFTALSAGDYHALALRNDNTVWVWGFGEYGQLGDNSPTFRPAPVSVTLP